VNALLLYAVVGVFVLTEYWLIWRGRPSVRHAVLWPIVVVCQLGRVAPPTWMRPAAGDVEAQALDGWTRG
jgi:hypothetical protein